MIINPNEYGTLIGVDDEVLAELQRRALPFIDDPNGVLRRELGLDSANGRRQPANAKPADRPTTTPRANGAQARGVARTMHKKPPRAPKGSLTPEEAFELPLLRALADAGGQMPAREALVRVGALMSEVLNTEDRFEDNKGVARWEKRVPFVRLKLVERGLMRKDAPRGFWEISDAGRQRLAALTVAQDMGGH